MNSHIYCCAGPVYPASIPVELSRSDESLEKGQLDNKEQEQSVKVLLRCQVYCYGQDDKISQRYQF